MTEYEKMVQGQLYDPGDADILQEQRKFAEKLWYFNGWKPSEEEQKQDYMKEVFAECGEGCFIELPLRANWGGHHLHLGSGVYLNSNVTLVDDGHIYIGNKTMIGPNVTIATASHPLDAEERSRGLQYNEDVYIGENAWIGSSAVILPGVHIGSHTVIGAGSVVTHDIPDHVVAAGNPAGIIKYL